jgi:hypothetical protein
MNGLKTITFCVSFQFLTMFYAIVGAGAVRPKDAAPCGSGSATLAFSMHILYISIFFHRIRRKKNVKPYVNFYSFY